MSEVTTEGDTTVKLSKKALKELEQKAKPFEGKKACLERIIMQNCGSPKETEEQTESQEETKE